MPQARLALLLCLGLLGSAHADPWVVHNLDASGYQNWINQLHGKNYLPVLVSTHSRAGKPIFAALAVPNKDRLEWLIRFGQTSDDYQVLFDKMTARGFYLVSVSGYRDQRLVRFSSIWIKNPEGPAWRALHDLGGTAYQMAQDSASRDHMRPFVLNGYSSETGPRYAAIFYGDQGMPWLARRNLDTTDYQRLLDWYQAKGYRPAWASGFTESRLPRFNVVLVRDPLRKWQARHNLTAAALEELNQKMKEDGYQIDQISGYEVSGQSRYLATWSQRLPLPLSGASVPGLEGFDQAVLQFMNERNIQAGTLAVLRNNQVVLSRGYGLARRDGSRHVQPDDPFRLGSICKPFTAAAVRQLISQGKLREDTPIDSLLDIKPPPGIPRDPRWKSITVGHLLQHKGGWDNQVGPVFDPMFQALLIARSLKVPTPPRKSDYLRFMAGQPLQFDPGSKSVYSNFGYFLLGLIVEKVSRQSYATYLRQNLFDPLGLKSFELGRTVPSQRHPREPDYIDLGTAPNVLTGKGQITWPDGGFHLEIMDSHGGLIGSAPDLVRYFAEYGMDGHKGRGQTGTFFGSLPGTWTVVHQRPDGVLFAALFNQRSGTQRGAKKDAEIKDLLNRAADQVKTWPESARVTSER